MHSASPDHPARQNVRKLAAAWAVLFLLLAVTAALTLPGIRFETNILGLLPHSEQNPLVIAAQEKQSSLLNQTVIWLVGADNEQEALARAQTLEQELLDSRLFTQVHLRWNAGDAANTYQGLLPYRYHFLSADDKAAIMADARAFADNSIQILYSPLGMQHAATLQQDPLFTLGSYINSLNSTTAELYQDVAMLAGQGEKARPVYALILATVATAGPDTDSHNRMVSLYETAKERYDQGNNGLLVTGLPLYSAYGARSAQHEISTIGSLSTIAVVVLLLFAFRSPRPLLLSLLSISFGIVAALTLCNLAFEKVHIITLVFGSSLIGCIDYSFHYFCNSFQKDWNSYDGLKSIFTSIGLGMLGSVIAFLSLALTPFPGLQQMAVFSASGLFFAWLTVVLLFPFWSFSFSCRHPIPLAAFYPLYLDRWPAFFSRFRAIILLSGLVFIVAGVSQLNIQDDIRSMQKPNPDLLAQENAIKAIFNQKNDAQYFVVSGSSADDVLAREKQLTGELDKLVTSQKLDAYVALGSVYPGAAEQLQNHKLVRTAFFDSGLVRDIFTGISMDEATIADIYAETEQLTTSAMPLETWLQAAPPTWQQQWLGCGDNGCASVVNLKGIKDIAALQALAGQHQGTWFVDHVATINSIMQKYRSIAALFVGLAAIIITLMLVYPLGLRAALTIISIPLAAIALTIATTGFLGTPFNLFNVFALILVLGIAFDYSIFHYLGEDHKQSTSLAVLLSLVTTTLSFGLLMLSETTVIQAFGLTLSTGIAFAFMLSPLISVKKIEVYHE